MEQHGEFFSFQDRSQSETPDGWGTAINLADSGFGDSSFGQVDFGSMMPFGNDMFGGLWMDHPSTINMGGFAGMPMEFEVLDTAMSIGSDGAEALNIVFDPDATHEEIAEALGVPLDEIVFAEAINEDMNGMVNLGEDFAGDIPAEFMESYLGIGIAEGFEGDYFDAIVSNDEYFAVEAENVESILTMAQSELSQLDTDGDGLASGEEIAASYSQMYGLRDAAAQGAATGLVGEFDANQDNALDLEELIVSYNQEAAQAELEVLDSDGDGTVSVEEFADDYRQTTGLREAAVLGAADGMIQSHDANEDGVIDLDELTASYPVDLGSDSPDSDATENATLVQAAIQADFAADATPEEIAETLGVDVEDIVFEDAVIIEDMIDDEAIAIQADFDVDATPEEIAEVLGVVPEDIIVVDSLFDAREVGLSDGFAIDFFRPMQLSSFYSPSTQMFGAGETDNQDDLADLMKTASIAAMRSMNGDGFGSRAVFSPMDSFSLYDSIYADMAEDDESDRGWGFADTNFTSQLLGRRV